MRERASFLTYLGNQLETSRNAGVETGLLIVKVQRFREINAAYGYQSGDSLLAEIEQRIKQVLRSSDHIERISDNEFALLLPAIMNKGHTILAATRIIQEFDKPITVNNQHISVNIIIGIAIFPGHGEDVDTLMQNADRALNQARTIHDHYVIYSEDHSKGPSTSLAIEAALLHAIEEDAIDLYFQPQIDIKGNTVKGAEALCRWHSHDHGIVSPADFIPIAEKTDLIYMLTKWSLNSSLRHSAQYSEFNENFSIAINLSPILLQDPDIVELVVGAISIWGVAPNRLIMEVTEGAMMQQPELSQSILHQFHDAGVLIAIDDFGTGYSSLAYLKELPVTELKIDKSFVLNMVDNKKDASIVRSVIDLAHNLEMKVTAEGIENRATLDLLRSMGCDYGQGFYLARPMPAQQMGVWLRESGESKAISSLV